MLQCFIATPGDNQDPVVNVDDVGEERLVWLDCRSALLWISQEAEEYGIDWE